MVRKLPTNNDQFVIIIDAANLASENSSISVLKYEIDVLQNHYPERLFKLHAVNMTWLPRTIWMAVKPFLKESTRNKIELTGDNSEEIFTKLVQEIDPDGIPIDLGGKFYL